MSELSFPTTSITSKEVADSKHGVRYFIDPRTGNRYAAVQNDWWGAAGMRKGAKEYLAKGYVEVTQDQYFNPDYMNGKVNQIKSDGGGGDGGGGDQTVSPVQTAKQDSRADHKTTGSHGDTKVDSGRDSIVSQVNPNVGGSSSAQSSGSSQSQTTQTGSADNIVHSDVSYEVTSITHGPSQYVEAPITMVMSDTAWSERLSSGAAVPLALIAGVVAVAGLAVWRFSRSDQTGSRRQRRRQKRRSRRGKE